MMKELLNLVKRLDNLLERMEESSKQNRALLNELKEIRANKVIELPASTNNGQRA